MYNFYCETIWKYLGRQNRDEYFVNDEKPKNPNEIFTGKTAKPKNPNEISAETEKCGFPNENFAESDFQNEIFSPNADFPNDISAESIESQNPNEIFPENSTSKSPNEIFIDKTTREAGP